MVSWDSSPDKVSHFSTKALKGVNYSKVVSTHPIVSVGGGRQFIYQMGYGQWLFTDMMTFKTVCVGI